MTWSLAARLGEAGDIEWSKKPRRDEKKAREEGNQSMEETIGKQTRSK